MQGATHGLKLSHTHHAKPMITLFFSYTDAVYAQTQTQYALQKCLCDTLYMQHVLPLKTQG